jgi:hypothetical protein
MYASQRSNKSPSVFVAAKAATAIPVAHELVRDALVQAALDPAVHALEFIPTVDVSGTNVRIDAIVVSRTDGRHLLDVIGARTISNSSPGSTLSTSRSPSGRDRSRRNAKRGSGSLPRRGSHTSATTFRACRIWLAAMRRGIGA